MAARPVPQPASMEQALGQIQGAMAAIQDVLDQLTAQASAAAKQAAEERHEMLGRIQSLSDENAALSRNIEALSAKVEAMMPTVQRVNRYGLILMGVFAGASAVGGAFGAKVWPILMKIVGIGG